MHAPPLMPEGSRGHRCGVLGAPYAQRQEVKRANGATVASLERLPGSCRAFSLNFVAVVVNTVRNDKTKTVELFLWSRKSAAAEGGLRLIPQSPASRPLLSDGQGLLSRPT